MPMNDNPKWKIIHGDALKVLLQFAPDTFDAGGEKPVYSKEVFQHGRKCSAAL